jgi:hypothetical protein
MPCSKTNGVAALVALALACAAPAWAQETINAGRARILERAVIGGATIPTTGVLRLIGAPTRTAGQAILSISGTGDVTSGTLARSDLPTPIAYEDEANTFALAQILNGTATFNAAATFAAAAPATFNGTATLNGAATFTSTATIARSAASLTITDTASPTDHKRTELIGFGGAFFIQHINDAGSLVIGRPIISTPYGSLVLDPYSKQILPAAAYEGTVGSPLQKFLAGYFAELHADVLTSAETLATTGGRWLVAPSTTLLEDIGTAATTIKTKHNNLANGDVIYLENERVEFMTVTSAATRINKAGIGNLSGENGTTHWSTSGSASISQSAVEHWHGGRSIKWQYGSGLANILYNPAGMLANATQYTVSLYVKRSDGAAVVPVAGGAYRLFVDGQNGVTCDAAAADVGDGWYRLSCTGTTGGAGAAATGIAVLPTTVDHYVDAVQVELGATLTPWSRDSASYTVTRSLDPTGADVWEAGTGIVNTRSTGLGLIDCYATQGFSSATAIGPTCAGMVRTSATYNAMAPRWAIGNLNGLYGYATDVYGAAFGDATAANLTLDATNGIRFRNATTNTLTITGNTIDLVNAGVIKSGAASALTTGTGIWLAANSGTPQFRIGNPAGNSLRWDGTTLELYSERLRITGNGLSILGDSTFNLLASLAFRDPTTTNAAAHVGYLSGSGGVYPVHTLKLQAGEVGMGVTTSAARNAAVLMLVDSCATPAGCTPAGAGVVHSTVELRSGPDFAGGQFLIAPNGTTVLGVSTIASTPGFPMIRGNGSDLAINGATSLYLNRDVTGTVLSNSLRLANLSATPTASSYAGLIEFQGVGSNPTLGYTYMGDGSGWRWEWYSRTASTNTLRFVFDDRGRLGIGAIVPANSLQLAIDSAGKPTSSTWSIVSDRRTKRNIAPMGSELARLRALPLVTYEYNGVAGTPAGDVGVGAVSDEVAPLYPRAVRWQGEGADRVQAMDWHAIFVSNVRATQELAAKVEALEAALAARPPAGGRP